MVAATRVSPAEAWLLTTCSASAGCSLATVSAGDACTCALSCKVAGSDSFAVFLRFDKVSVSAFSSDGAPSGFRLLVLAEKHQVSLAP